MRKRRDANKWVDEVSDESEAPKFHFSLGGDYDGYIDPLSLKEAEDLLVELTKAISTAKGEK